MLRVRVWGFRGVGFRVYDETLGLQGSREEVPYNTHICKLSIHLMSIFCSLSCPLFSKFSSLHWNFDFDLYSRWVHSVADRNKRNPKRILPQLGLQSLRIPQLHMVFVVV